MIEDKTVAKNHSICGPIYSFTPLCTHLIIRLQFPMYVTIIHAEGHSPTFMEGIRHIYVQWLKQKSKWDEIRPTN